MPPGLILIHQVPAESEMPASEQEPESASAHLAGLAALWNLCFHWSWKKEIFIIWKHSSGPRANRLWGAGSSAQQLRDTAWGWPGRALGSSGQLKTLFLFWFWFFFFLLKRVFLEKTLQVWDSSRESLQVLDLCPISGPGQGWAELPLLAQLPNHEGVLAALPWAQHIPPSPKKSRHTEKMDSAIIQPSGHSISHLPCVASNLIITAHPCSWPSFTQQRRRSFGINGIKVQLWTFHSVSKLLTLSSGSKIEKEVLEN